ncbi:glucan endo-1,3-beta-glucosidase-like [Chenopodium quinoa]|uniref:glucan endo-1,3-beta-glucosidase-like n=1 Tax=Chenopodium quinoa TaxID=63459 RepID=UPI000B77C613|nr:glucan endo-1,3-beta-glucosidase-like [Chenopodium quinoa]
MAAATSLLITSFILLGLHLTEAQIGVCYGRKGNNLPSGENTTQLYDYYGIEAMRLYEPDETTLKALQGAGIKLMLGVPNEEIECMACDQPIADEWVQDNVVPYVEFIKYIVVGNEIHPSDQPASSVESAMQNILNALNSNNITSDIKVSTAIDTSLIINSYPPSNAKFKNLSYVGPIINFLTINESPLLVNIQPYTTYMNDPKNIRLDFALFTACGIVFTDENSGKNYQNLFDAIYDAMYVAIEKVVTNAPNDEYTYSVDNGRRHNKRHKPPRVVISESGWPSKGGFGEKIKMKASRKRHHQTNGGLECGGELHNGVEEAATPENAKTYYTNLIKHVKKGTPLTLGQEIETYLFAMFDEDQKPGDESERSYGLFTPDQQPKYGVLDIC